MYSQRGNALFLILIAVALFAALSYVITQSGRSGSGAIDREQASLKAGQIAQQAAMVRTAVTRMVITGLATSTNVSLQQDTSLSPCDTAPQTCVFDAAGGGTLDPTPPIDAGIWVGGGHGYVLGGPTGNDWGAWGYKDTVDPSLGYYIEDLGTNTDVTGRDTFAYLRDMTQAVCEQINRGLAITPMPTSATVEYDGNNTGLGEATYNTSDNTYTGTSGAAFACVNMATSYYHYYHALVEH